MSVASGHTWETDPEGNRLASGGRTRRTWVRSSDRSVRAIVKQHPSLVSWEVYSIGMERVAYVLGDSLGLAVPTVWLEDVGGTPSAVVEHIPNTRTWQQAGA